MHYYPKGPIPENMVQRNICSSGLFFIEGFIFYYTLLFATFTYIFTSDDNSALSKKKKQLLNITAKCLIPFQ